MHIQRHLSNASTLPDYGEGDCAASSGEHNPKRLKKKREPRV